MNIIDRLKRNSWTYSILILGIVYWITIFLRLWDPSFDPIDFIMFLIYFFVALISLVIGIIKGKRLKWKSIIPFSLAIIMIIIPQYILRYATPTINNWYFNKNFQYYAQMVDQIKSGQIAISNRFNDIPKPKGFPAFRIHAVRYYDGRIMVDFCIGAGGGKYAWGYRYLSEGQLNKDMVVIKTLRELRPNWYYYFR